MQSPQSLQEWREQDNGEEGVYPRAFWTPLESFFLSQGYTLWGPPITWYISPPKRAPRTPDAFAYRTVYNEIKPERYSFSMINTIHCPARTTEGYDVLIRLMAIGIDRGERHLAAMSRLGTGNNALRGDNHIVPMLKEIVHKDMIFMVFPLMASGFDYPWYYRFSEVLDAAEQVLEGIKFCHEQLVAHQDIDGDNILINWIGGRCQSPESLADGGILGPFRSLFPVRYFINDFEFARTFDPSSEPSSRVVTGLPVDGARTGEYRRSRAPEMLSGAEYCPFRLDIWQLGKLFKLTFGHLGHLSQPLIELIDEMCSENPSSRPNASDALERVRLLKFSCSTLSSEVPRKPRK